MATQPLFDMSKAQPIQAAAPLFDMSKAKPLNAEPPISGFWDTLQREGKSLAGTIAGMPAAIYHAFSEPATPEEKNEFGGQDQVTGAKRVGLGIHRLAIAPVETAVDWYSDVARDKIPDAYEQALSVAPEAMGVGAGTVIAGKLAQEAPGAVKATVTKTPAAAGSVLNAMSQYGVPVAKALGKTIDAASFERIGKIWNAWKDLPEEVRSRGPQFSDPGAPLPEHPPIELLQARALGEIGQEPPAEPSAALGTVSPPNLSALAGSSGTTPAEIEPSGAIPGAGIPRTLAGDSALRRILTGQDNANLLKIARSRGINVT